MTLKDAIDKHNALIDSNPYTNDQMTDLVNTLENMIQPEILHTYPFIATQDQDTGEITRTEGTLISYDWGTDQETELKLSGTPFEDLYDLYLVSMIYFYQADWMRYSNVKNMFNARFQAAMNYYSRTVEKVQENSINNLW